MATVKICDICKEQKATPFTVTEKNGDVFDICSAGCLTKHTAGVDGAS
jgi:hypothetical protein